SPGEELQTAGAGMERVMGFEPTTFSLGSIVPRIVTDGRDGVSEQRGAPLSLPLSPPSPKRDPLALALELLAAAESSSNPAALIAAARARVVEAAAQQVDRGASGRGTKSA